MLILERILWIMGDNGCTAVKLYCSVDLRKEIAAHFTDAFNKEYGKLMDRIEEEEGICYEKENKLNPFIGALVTDYGVFLPFNALSMYCDKYGDIISGYNAEGAMEKALQTIKQEYPSISYEGYVAYCWSDIHSGEACQREISSKKKKDMGDVIYDFIGEALGRTLEDEENWERLSEELEYEDEGEFKKIIKLFHTYSKWIPSDAIERIIEISENCDEDIAESLKAFSNSLKSDENV